MGPMFGTTWGDDTFEIPYGESAASTSALSSEWEPDWVSKEPTPSKEPKEPECMAREPSKGCGSRTYMCGTRFLNVHNRINLFWG